VGNCAAEGGVCKVGSAAHCKDSVWCKRLGNCALREGENGPVCGK
jgi:hypothetical protein